LHQQECFAYLEIPAGAFPHAELAASQTLALPVYPEFTEQQRMAVIASLSAFWQVS